MNKAPDPQSYEFFLATWQVYRKIVDANYMYHREIYSEILKTLKAKTNNALTILDLGCGDTGTMRPILEQIPFSNYLGIDASQPALQIARDELHAFDDRVELHCSDMLSFLEECAPRTFDVILVSFSLHHLETEQKKDLLTLCKERLSPSGDLLVVDVFRNKEQSLKDYLDAYCEDMTRRWTTLTPEESQMAVEHVRNHDLPETLENFLQLAHQAGLNRHGETMRYGFHMITTLSH